MILKDLKAMKVIETKDLTVFMWIIVLFNKDKAQYENLKFRKSLS